MRRYRTIVLGAAVVAWLHSTAPIYAANGANDYAAFRLIGGISTVDGIGHTGGGNLEIRNDDDEVAGIALVVGYDWAGKGVPVRSELEYHHRFRFDFDTRINGGSNAGFENQLSSDAVLVNLYYDFLTSRSVRPYVGVGAGWALNSSEVDRVPLSGGAKEEREDSKSNFAWSVMLGGLIDVSEHWQFEVSYRYIDLGEVESGPFDDGATLTAGDYTSHDLILGFTYRF